MNPGLLQLVLRSTRGRLVRWARLLKQPKYLIGLLAALLYWTWLFGSRVRGQHVTIEPQHLEAIRVAAALGGAAVVTLTWTYRPGAPLALTEADAQLLFTAPVERRQLVRYALLKVQPPVLFGSALATVVFGGGDLARRLLRWPGAWALLTLWLLHHVAASLWKLRRQELPASTRVRHHGIVWAALLAFWAVVAVGLWTAGSEPLAVLRAGGEPRAAAVAFSAALEDAHALRWALAPFTLPLQAVLAETLADRAVGWAACLVALVLLEQACERTRARFEDAVLERARFVTEVQSVGLGALRRRLSPKRRRTVPWDLAPAGRPEVAIAWKNLLLIGRRRLAWGVGRGALVLGAVFAVDVALGAPLPLLMMQVGLGTVMAILVPLLAGTAWRADLRSDLLSVDVLRTWPLSGRALVAGEIATPALQAFLASSFGFGLVVVSWAAGTLLSTRGFGGVGPLAPLGVVLGAAGALPLLLGACALSAALQNYAVLLAPGWFRLGHKPMPGPTALGQQILTVAALSVMLAVGLLPGALVVGAAALVHGVSGLPFTPWELPVLGTLAAVPMIALSLLVVRWAGSAWDRLDPSREILEG